MMMMVNSDYDDDDDDDDLEKVDEVDGEDGTHPIVRESFARLHPNDEEDPPAVNINTASEENVAYLGYSKYRKYSKYKYCGRRKCSLLGIWDRLVMAASLSFMQLEVIFCRWF